MSASENLKRYITGPQVDKRYNIVPRTRNRWKKDPKLGFPVPLLINGREFYDETDLDEFDRRCARAAPSANLKKVA